MIEFEIVGEVSEIQTIAVGPSVRDRARLRKQYGVARWRKLKGIANVRLVSGRIRLAEIHWMKRMVLANESSKSSCLS